MEFEEIDRVTGDTLDKGDIICENGEFHQVKFAMDDEVDLITLATYNLSTGDEDEVIVDPDASYDLFRSY